LEKRLKVFTQGKGWRNGTIKAYHGGYLRHTSELTNLTRPSHNVLLPLLSGTACGTAT
jgi:hypothetical protein